MSLPGQLYMLQQIDLELQRKQQELNGVESQLNDDKALVTAEAKFACQKEQLADARKRQKSAEWELEDIQEKITKLHSKLYNGATKNPKELVNLEHEGKSLKSKISGQEDELLELMGQVEELEAEVKTSTEELKQLKQEWQQRQGALKQRKNEIERTIRILEWDKSMKQINPAKKTQLEQYKNELEDIKAKLNPENVKENE